MSTLTGYSEWTVFTTQRACISWQNIIASAKLSQASNHDSHWWLGLLHFCQIVSNHENTLLTFWLQCVNLNFTLRLACNTWFSYNIVILSTILWYYPCTTLTDMNDWTCSASIGWPKWWDMLLSCCVTFGWKWWHSQKHKLVDRWSRGGKVKPFNTLFRIYFFLAFYAWLSSHLQFQG